MHNVENLFKYKVLQKTLAEVQQSIHRSRVQHSQLSPSLHLNAPRYPTTMQQIPREREPPSASL